MELAMVFGTYSSDSVPCPETMRSAAMLVCQTDKSASGQWVSGRGPAWNAPGNGSLVLSMENYLCCTFQTILVTNDHPSVRKPLSHSLERDWCWMHWGIRQGHTALEGSESTWRVDNFWFGGWEEGVDGGSGRPGAGTRKR